ncbi:MAG: hypothetical protein NTU48_09105 [Legionellales bacterium]|nr:hypothetical protein [Legionellales bacterium]
MNAELPLHSAVQKKKPKNWKHLIVTHIDTWLDQAPVDTLDSTAVTAWIKTHIANFAALDELCLCHFWNSPTSSAQRFIQAQWQRLPTRGTLGPVYNSSPTPTCRGLSAASRRWSNYN